MLLTKRGRLLGDAPTNGKQFRESDEKGLSGSNQRQLPNSRRQSLSRVAKRFLSWI